VPSPPPLPDPGTLKAKLANTLIGVHTQLYRVSGGRLGRKLQGVPILLLDHVGRKSGKRRTTPLMYLDDGEDVVIVGSRGGSDHTPAWWLNLRDAGEGEVQVGGERRRVRPRLAEGEERARLWPRLVALYPNYDLYRTRTEREIPVIVLEPTAR